MVTSPGGTSAAAIHELEKGRLRTVLSEAVWAAYRRTEELGRQLELETAAEESESAKPAAMRPVTGTLDRPARRSSRRCRGRQGDDRHHDERAQDGPPAAHRDRVLRHRRRRLHLGHAGSPWLAREPGRGPAAHVPPQARRPADLPATARIITEEAERRPILEHITAVWGRQSAGRGLRRSRAAHRGHLDDELPAVASVRPRR